MGDNNLSEMLQEANSIYNLAERAEKEGENLRAKQAYERAQSLFREMFVERADKNKAAAESMKLIADTCEKRISIIELKEELIPKPDFGKATEQSQKCGMSINTSRTLGPKYTILSQSELNMQGKSTEEENGMAIEELESVRLNLIKMNSKLKAMLQSSLELFLKLESCYKIDIKKILEDNSLNPFDEVPKINLKTFEKNMSHMKRILSKIANASNSNFEKEIKNVSSSIHTSSIISNSLQKSTFGVPKDTEIQEGLPPGVTKEIMDAYLAKAELPLYVKHEEFSEIRDRARKLQRAKDEYKKRLEKYRAEVSKAAGKDKKYKELKEKLRELEFNMSKCTQENQKLKSIIQTSNLTTLRSQ